jgi:hypothetical protein
MGLLKIKLFSEKYEAGFFDIKGIKPVLINFKEDEVEFKILSGFSSKKVILKPNDLVEVGLNQETYRSGGRAAAGALVGGILTGGIGLLAGAALGGKRRKENHLHLVVQYKGTDSEIFIKPSKNTQDIYNELKRLFSKQDKKPIVDNSQSDAKFEISVELEKLHELVQKGILTKEEFEAQKKKLLSL